MAICRQVEEGFACRSGEYLLEVDRRQAINLAIDMAQPGDVVLVAGKGHENYQILRIGSSTLTTGKKLPGH